MSPVRMLLCLALLAVSLQAAELPDIQTVEPDLTVPAVEHGAPAAGHRVAQTTHDWQGSEVHHTLYLPMNWKPGGKFPVLVEYPGNGPFQDKYGDVSDGSVEQCRMGYGLSAGRDYIWVSMPFVSVKDGAKANQTLWWGDADETAAYCVATVKEVCRDFGGDERAVVLSGFSRGSIACNYIGLRNDTIAGLWCGFLCHSHYDGVKTGWPYANADRASALTRLQRLKGRPQFISQEVSTGPTKRYLEEIGVTGNFTFVDFAFRNHTDLWALRDCDLRQRARGWLRSIGLPAP